MERKKSDHRSVSPADRRVIMGIFVVAVGLILLTGTRCGAEKKRPIQGEAEISGYRMSLEKRVENLREGVEGVGRTQVFLTLEQGWETVYAAGKNRVETVREPGIKGVVVVCQGGSDRTVRARVTEAVATALGIGWDTVSVQPL